MLCGWKVVAMVPCSEVFLNHEQIYKYVVLSSLFLIVIMHAQILLNVPFILALCCVHQSMPRTDNKLWLPVDGACGF